MPRSTRPVPREFHDKHLLYEGAVQEVDADLDFMARMFRRHRTRPARLLREDFCGTAKLSAAWVRRNPDHTALGIDNHAPTLAWGERHHRAPLGEAADRLHLIHDDVRAVKHPLADMTCAFNFSYNLFTTRNALRAYLQSARAALVKDGLFVMDAFGGTECMGPAKDVRSIPHAVTPDGRRIPTYIYEWEQRLFDAVTHRFVADIHFELRDGTRLNRAFTYDWRLWSLPELQELVLEAGFREVEVYMHGYDDQGEPDGIYRRRTRFDNEAGWLAYVVAVR